jgi:anti-sigma factor RsiW
MLDQHIIELINADLDGELGADEIRELKSILDSSSEAASFRDELLQLNNAIANVPELDPPARLSRTILDQVQLPARRGLFQLPASRPVDGGWVLSGRFPTSIATRHVQHGRHHGGWRADHRSRPG